MSTHHAIRTGQATGLGSYPLVTIPNLDPGLVRSDQIKSVQIRSDQPRPQAGQGVTTVLPDPCCTAITASSCTHRAAVSHCCSVPSSTAVIKATQSPFIRIVCPTWYHASPAHAPVLLQVGGPEGVAALPLRMPQQRALLVATAPALRVVALNDGWVFSKAEGGGCLQESQSPGMSKHACSTDSEKSGHVKTRSTGLRM